MSKARNLWLGVLLGGAAFGGAVLLGDLPASIERGINGQAAIQMLDTMRRPFLGIKDAEALLLKTSDRESAEAKLVEAIADGDTLLARYRQLAQYNPGLLASVTRLSRVYKDWAAQERRLFAHHPAEHALPELAGTAAGFLDTMAQLGEGEHPIHEDIAAGRRANNLLLVLLAGLFLYLIGLLFLQQRARARLLQQAHDELEVRVAARTSDLQDANARLHDEIAHHKRTAQALRTETSYKHVLQVVATAANEASTIAEAMHICLEQVCALTRWPIGHVYLLSAEHPPCLRPTDLWHMDDPERFRPFRQATAVTCFGHSVGLPGRVLATGKPAWIADISQDHDFLRAELAQETGIRAGFAFPVLIGTEVVAVLEFFSTTPAPPDDALLELMAHVGAQLGRVVERTRSEDALRQAKEGLEQKVQERTADLEQSNRQLAVARDRALEAARVKSEFLANMSHEIRTPMNGVLGMLDLLRDTALGPTQQEYLDIAHHSAESLLTLLNDILDLSKMEANKLHLEEVDFDLRELVDEVTRLLDNHAAKKGIALRCRVSPDIPAQLQADPTRLRQVLTNLVSNAIKFTDQGEVAIRITPGEHPAPRCGPSLRFEVRDTGIGISPEVQPSIFAAFSQADGSTTRKYGGTGLGLAICKRLVERMGGEIGVDSAPGRGSNFWFTLPVTASQQSARMAG